MEDTDKYGVIATDDETGKLHRVKEMVKSQERKTRPPTLP